MAPRVTASPSPGSQPAAWPKPADLRAIHHAMTLLRAADARSTDLSLHGHAGLHVPATGTEALLAGVACRLAPTDWVLPGTRQSLIALARGLSLDAWFAHVLGRATDPARGRQSPGGLAARSVRVGSAATPLGANLTHAVGVARAMKHAKRREAAVALAGQAAVAGGDFHVALNFAAVWSVPAVFVIASGEGLDRHTASESVAVKASAYGMAATTCDAADPLSVATAVEGALEQARDGGGPMLVEARFPWRPARSLKVAGADDAHDPLVAFTARLVADKVLTTEEAQAVADELHAKAAAAAEAALHLPPPPPLTLFEDVFVRRTPALDAQRAEWLSVPHRPTER